MLGWLFEALRDVFSMPEMSVDMVVAKPPDAVVAFQSTMPSFALLVCSSVVQ